jgi:hypothetical protein
MSITMITEFSGVGIEKYDAICNEIGLKKGSNDNWPAELIWHTAGATESGFCVVELWQSEEAFNRYFEDRLGPAFAKESMPEPRVTKFETHNRYPHEDISKRSQPSAAQNEQRH